jgi:cytidine deaminase
MERGDKVDDFKKLLESANRARKKAYAPYSRFSVGAALLTEDGKIYDGCNVENLSYGLTICAERVAVFSAIAAGSRNFTGLSLVADTPDPITPCGACRQVLYEFSPDLWVISTNLAGKQKKFRLRELLPDAFQADI